MDANVSETFKVAQGYVEIVLFQIRNISFIFIYSTLDVPFNRDIAVEIFPNDCEF